MHAVSWRYTDAHAFLPGQTTSKNLIILSYKMQPLGCSLTHAFAHTPHIVHARGDPTHDYAIRRARV